MRNIIYNTIQTKLEAKKKAWLITVIATEGSSPGELGMKMVLDIDGEIIGTVGGGAVELLITRKILEEQPTQALCWNFDLGANTSSSEKTGMICGGNQTVFVEPLFTEAELYIMGGGHCGKALAELAAKCDFVVTVIDDRETYITAEQHPYATHRVCSSYSDIARHIHFSPSIFVAIMTYGHHHDEVCMRQILGHEYKYLGVIGSSHKAQNILKKLLADGFDPEELKRIFSPIGLDIGSQKPYEIAVSIMAQLLAVKNNCLPS